MRVSPPLLLHKYCHHEVLFPPDMFSRKQGLVALAFCHFHVEHSHFMETRWMHQRSLQLALWKLCCKPLSQRIWSWSSHSYLSCPLVLITAAVHAFLVSPRAWRPLQLPGRRRNQVLQKFVKRNNTKWPNSVVVLF